MRYPTLEKIGRFEVIAKTETSDDGSHRLLIRAPKGTLRHRPNRTLYAAVDWNNETGEFVSRYGIPAGAIFTYSRGYYEAAIGHVAAWADLKTALARFAPEPEEGYPASAVGEYLDSLEVSGIGAGPNDHL